MNKKYARLIVDNKASKLDNLFTYIIEDDLVDIVEVGMRVLVPFGRGNKVIKALIIEIEDQTLEKYKFKNRRRRYLSLWRSVLVGRRVNKYYKKCY